MIVTSLILMPFPSDQPTAFSILATIADILNRLNFFWDVSEGNYISVPGLFSEVTAHAMLHLFECGVIIPRTKTQVTVK